MPRLSPGWPAFLRTRVIHQRSDNSWIAAFVIVLTGLILRLLVLPYGNFVFDTSTMARWASRLTRLPLDHFYATRNLADHLPGDLWLLLSVARVHTALFLALDFRAPSFVIALKVTAIVADLGICGMLYLLGSELGGRRAGQRAAAFYAINPASIFLSSAWGQWDSVSALLILVALWFLVRGAIQWALPVMVYATLIKPQLVILIPFLVAAYVLHIWRETQPAVRRSADIRHLVVLSILRFAAGLASAVAVVVMTTRPFGLGLPFLAGRWNLIDRLHYAADVHPYTTVNAFNAWAVLHAQALAADQFVADSGSFLIGPSFQAWGVALTCISLVLIGLVMIRRWRNATTLVYALSAVTVVMFLLSTRMHERYLLPGIVMMALAASLNARVRWSYGLLSLGFLINLLWAYDSYYPLGMPDWWHTEQFVLIVSLVNVGAFGLMLMALTRSTNGPFEQRSPHGWLADSPRDDSSYMGLDRFLHLMHRIPARVGLTVVLMTALLLNSVALGDEGFGNLYYAAAVKSMSLNWHNFLFGAFDPAGFLAVDKPPVGLWLQVLSTQIFGFAGISLRLPQILAGTLSVGLLYRMVCETHGRAAGFIAGVTLALTPIAVVTNRNNTMDSVLVLVLLGAGWAALRATNTGQIRWLLLCAGCIGLGFNVKMAEALLIAPACFLLFVVAAPLPSRQRWAGLAIATLVMIGVGLAWILAVDLTPAAQRPYLASTLHNSAIELALQHNGLDRLLWGHSLSNPGSLGHPSRQIIGDPGPLRMLDYRLATQYGWLLPFAVLGGLAAIRARRGTCANRKTGAALRLDARGRALFFWSVWITSGMAFFSVANYFHRYYTIVLSPALAAMVAIGFVALWESLWRPGLRRWLLPAAVLATACFQAWLLVPFPEWRLRLAPTVIALALLVSVPLLAIAHRKYAGSWRVARCAVIVGMAAMLIAPMAWSAVSIWQGEANAAFPFAGPASSVKHPSTRINQRFLQLLQAHQAPTSVLVTTSTADAAPLIIGSHLSVLALGGYSGNDSVLTNEEFARWLVEGKLRFFLLPRPKQAPSGGPLRWVADHCTLVPPEMWQSTPPASHDSDTSHEFGGGRPQPSQRRLFDCGAYVKSSGKLVS